MYHQCADHAFTIHGICGILVVTFIWIVQNYLQLLSCPVVSIIAIHFCMVDTDLTKRQNLQNQIAHVVTKSPPFSCSVPLRFSTSLVAGKISNIVQDQFVDLQNISWKAAQLSSVYPCPITAISFTNFKQRNSSVRVKIGTGARAFHTCAWSLWNNLLLSVCSAISLATFPETSEDTSLGLGLSPQHTPQTIDVMELFHQFCCWTLIWL